MRFKNLVDNNFKFILIIKYNHVWEFVSYGTGRWSFLLDKTLYIIADGERS